MQSDIPDNPSIYTFLTQFCALALNERAKVRDFIEFLPAKKMRRDKNALMYEAWTDEVLQHLSAQWLKRGWELEDSIYDDL